VTDRIRHLGFVSEVELVELYANAALCIAASRDEGFNMLPLEAMTCGAPVVCSDIAVHRELFENAATFFPTENAPLLAEAIGSALRDPHGPRHLAAGVEACIARLSWAAMARRMAAFFDEACQPQYGASVTAG
jgi:glycosyltransferase involved in cell wall biosynthesis